MNRKQLANVRVVQKNLVYILGLTAKVANEEVKTDKGFAFHIDFCNLKLDTPVSLFFFVIIL
jgi:hypothetical protein